MFCSQCGKQNTDDAVFCGYCGKELFRLPDQKLPVVEPGSPAPKEEPAPVVEPEPVVEPIAASVVEPIATPVAEPVAAPMVEPIAIEPEPIAEPIAEPIIEPVAEPIAEAVAEPVVVEPEPIVEPVAAPVVEPEPIVEPAVEAPVQEPDAPAIEAAVVEAPAMDTPAIEAPVVEAPAIEAPTVEAPAAEPPAQKEAAITEEKPKKKKKHKALPFVIIAIVLVLLLIAGGAAFLFFYFKAPINLDDYVVVETDGYNGIGTARVSIDWDAMEEKYNTNLLFTSAAYKEFGDDVDGMSPVDVLKRYVSVDLERTKGLSNGMEVYYDWDIDEDYSDYLRIDLKYDDDLKYEVSGLKEAEIFDAFADLTVRFVGAEPYGTVVIEYTGTELSAEDFIFEYPEEGLKNGDVIVIRIDESKLDALVDNYGKVPEVLEMEYTVEGLSDHLTQVADISDDSMESMKTEAANAMTAYISENWGGGESLTSMTYVGCIFLTSKTTEGANKLYLVYKIEVRNTFVNGDKAYDQINTYYWYICFENVGIGSDGQIVYDASTAVTPTNMYTIESGITVSGTKIVWDYFGYKTFQDLLDDLMAMFGNDYDFENNIDESLVAEPDITPTPTVTPTPIDTSTLEATYITPTGLTASAYYIQGEGTANEKHFVPELVLDGDVGTAWNVRGHYADEDGDGEVEYTETCGVGEFIDFEFKPGTLVKSITIYPGFIYSLDDSVNRFGKNYAPTVVTVSAGSKSYTIDLTEYAYDVSLAYYGYTFEFPEWLYLKDGHLRLTINEVRNICYENHEDWWNDCCISEVEFMGYVPGDEEY